jgi:UDP-glucose 4-epimerase
VRVVVAGATGFVASHLVPSLAEDGHEVLALGHDLRRIPFADGVTPVEADLRAPLPDLPPPDAVVQLAQANVPYPEGAEDIFSVNTACTHVLLELSRRAGARCFVYASSGSVYGDADGRLREDDPCRARDFYSATKLASESLVRSYEPFFATAILRPFAPYGPGQQRRLVAGLIDRIRVGRPVTLNDGARPRITPVFVRDVVRVVLAALAGHGHHTVNVAGDEVVDIRELALLIGETVGREPVFEQRSELAPGDLIGDNTRMHELYGVAPLVPLAEGQRLTIEAEAFA